VAAPGRLTSAWKSARTLPSARKYLVDLYRLLVREKKVRLISDLKSVYLLPPDYVKPHQRQDLQVIHTDLVRSLRLTGLYENCEVVGEHLIDSCTADLRPHYNGEEDLQAIINGTLYNLAIESDNVFFWAGKLIDRQRDEEGEPVLQGKKNAINLLWRLLLTFAEKREGLWDARPGAYPENFSRVGEVIAVLKKWFDTMTHREKPIYLYHALLLIVRRRQIDWSAMPDIIDTPIEKVDAIYRANLENGPLDLDDFVYDMHTGTREANARTRFALEGALVVNENSALRNPAYRTIYERLKERLDLYEDRGLTSAILGEKE
jgi:hypothetical protein